MKTLFQLVAIASLIQASCMAGETSVGGTEVIETCVGEYARLSGRELDAAADRVYLLTGKGQTDALFAEGEVGTFGERSGSYRSHLSCGVLFSEGSLSIYFLSEPQKDPLIHMPEIEQVTETPYAHRATGVHVLPHVIGMGVRRQAALRPEQTGRPLDRLREVALAIRGQLARARRDSCLWTAIRSLDVSKRSPYST